MTFSPTISGRLSTQPEKIIRTNPWYGKIQVEPGYVPMVHQLIWIPEEADNPRRRARLYVLDKRPSAGVCPDHGPGDDESPLQYFWGYQ